MRKINKIKKKNAENGITLIALVITIVILIILSVVTVNAVFGDSGLINMAQKAKDMTEEASVIEAVQLEIAGSFNESGLYDPDIALDNLKRKLGVTATKYEDGTLNLNYEGYNLVVTTKGTVIIPEKIINIESSHTPTTISYSWEELNKVAKAISNNYGEVDNETMEVTIEVDGINYTLGVGDLAIVEYNGVEKQVRILGFNHDKLSNMSDYGSTNTYAGISFEFVDSITTMRMNSTNSNLGGWKESELRSSLNDENTGMLVNLSNKEYIKQVKKSYIETYNDEDSVKISDDYLWLLSCSEIWNNGRDNIGYGYAITKEGEQYKYYLDINADADSNTDALVKNDEGWWLRSPFRDYRDGFSFVDGNGLASCIVANNNNIDVIPGFSI